MTAMAFLMVSTLGLSYPAHQIVRLVLPNMPLQLHPLYNRKYREKVAEVACWAISKEKPGYSFE
jgi:hypothetical protein